MSGDLNENLFRAIEADIGNYYGTPAVSLIDGKWFLEIEDYTGVNREEVSEAFAGAWIVQFGSEQAIVAWNHRAPAVGEVVGLEVAYDAGFEASGEGWNGEYPIGCMNGDSYKKTRAENLARLAATPQPDCGEGGDG